MNDHTTSLDHLRDIVEPASVSWWPPAPGWWVLIALLAMSAIFAAVKAVLNWRANAYRRLAFRELHLALSDVEVAQILKRTAMCAFPREQVARLSGSTWCQWLEQTSGVPMSDSVARQIGEGIFASREHETSPALKEFVASWIRSHQRPQPC